MKMTILKNFNLKELEKPFFIYDYTTLIKNVDLVKENIISAKIGKKESSFYYSLKSNPNAEILKDILTKFNGIDVSSENELDFCLKNNIAAHRITISGPAKTKSFLRKAIGCNVKAIHIDSFDECVEVLSLINDSTTTNFSLRLNTDSFSDKLGMGEEELELCISSRLPIDGFHFYLGREKYSRALLIEKLDKLELILNKYSIKRANIYVGLGLPSSILQEKLEIVQHKILATSGIDFHFEMGRVLVESCGSYCAPVLSVKNKKTAKPSVIINGGIQHLSVSLINLLKKRENSTQVVILSESNLGKDVSEVNIYGSLCLSNDLVLIADLPKTIKRGDWLMFPATGAYNLSASATDFIGQDMAKEFYYKNENIFEISQHRLRLEF